MFRSDLITSRNKFEEVIGLPTGTSNRLECTSSSSSAAFGRTIHKDDLKFSMMTANRSILVQSCDISQKVNNFVNNSNQLIKPKLSVTPAR